jgi:flavin reductase (DIM6/NTAB) family NADH-FMN oxidoreductase RutF
MEGLFRNTISMNIDFATLTPTEIYHLMTQTVVPRPIAWILTDSGDKNYNLAPFSFFNAISSEPPLLMVSIGKKPSGEFKDTLINAKRNGSLVIHIAHHDLADELTQSAATLSHGESEISMLGLNTAEQNNFVLPRLACCQLAFNCRLHEVIEIGEVPQGLLFARIDSIYVSDDLHSLDAKGRSKIDASRISPLSRLGAGEYAKMGEVFSKTRPS